MPPQRFTAESPAVPSSRWPVRTTPITLGPWATAAERKSASTAGRCRFSRAPRVRRNIPSRSSR